MRALPTPSMSQRADPDRQSSAVCVGDRDVTQQDSDLTLTGVIESAETRDRPPSQVDHVAPRANGDQLGATHSQVPQAPPQEKQAQLPELPPMPAGLPMRILVPSAVSGLMPYISSSLGCRGCNQSINKRT